MTTEIHVRFSRPCDAGDCYETVLDHGPEARLSDEGIDVECDPVAEHALMLELEHAIDEWLAERELPFAPLEVGEHTLLVRAPGD
ncbi:MAG TPA: hypothetical protein VHD91_05775 [Gaiellaceae bacterium]|nr:hypothetical protein [Gaiellaceae bacterium]